MSLVIGLDTGGTYTDAALFDAVQGIVRTTGKALTTPEDLSIGLRVAIGKVLAAHDGTPDDIQLISLSTTLATNAVVEGVGGRVGLIMIGFDEGALERADLARALGQDPIHFINGGHKPDGGIQASLDIAAISTAAATLKYEVSAFAVAGHFATRNPLHETKARDILRNITGLPVTCSHELSSSLGGPRRALTAVLNARLINVLERLIAATQNIMAQHGLMCPLMVVKGDGSLLEAGFARSRPVETVLSGPAASLSGAAFLAGSKSTVVADIGGTTTDIAFLRNGTPRLKKDGAFVGGWQTMVEAAEIRTYGLGGDSEVTPLLRGRSGGLTLGPRRAMPLSLLALKWPQIKGHLKAQLALVTPMATDARFVYPIMPDGVPQWLTRSEIRLAKKAIACGPVPIADIAPTQLALGAVNRLISRSLLGLCSFTPTDAAHVIGKFKDFDHDAALLGAKLLARQRNSSGDNIADTPYLLAEMTLAELHRRSALALMDAAFAHEAGTEAAISCNPILSHSFDSQKPTGSLVSVEMTLNADLVALGASAPTHYPPIADVIGAKLIVPNHADVAGAIGAAAGSVRQRVMISITQPAEAKFRVHLPDGPVDKLNLDDALSLARITAKQLATKRAIDAGAQAVNVKLEEDIKIIPIASNTNLFIEALIFATAEGSPTRKIYREKLDR